jgi:hypothetical protein
MKKIIVFCALITLLIGMTLSARAQTPTQYRVSIPFDFNIGNKVFQAGDYIIAVADSKISRDILTIREAKSGKAQFIQIDSKTKTGAIEDSKLVFNLYEDQYFLAQMVSPTINGEFRKAKAEGRLAKMKKSEQKVVAIK